MEAVNLSTLGADSSGRFASRMLPFIDRNADDGGEGSSAIAESSWGGATWRNATTGFGITASGWLAATAGGAAWVTAIIAGAGFGATGSSLGGSYRCMCGNLSGKMETIAPTGICWQSWITS